MIPFKDYLSCIISDMRFRFNSVDLLKSLTMNDYLACSMLHPFYRSYPSEIFIVSIKYYPRFLTIIVDMMRIKANLWLNV